MVQAACSSAYSDSAPSCSGQWHHRLTATVIASDYSKVLPNTNTIQHQRVPPSTKLPISVLSEPYSQ